LKFIKTEITNTKSFDIFVRDVFGVEHRVFPGHSKKLVVLKKGRKKKND